MKSGYCLGCKRSALLIGDLCERCDPLAHSEDIAVILRIEKEGD